ncbi:hypothetical protein H5119_18720 [Pseudoalteromonas sp. SG45-5]|nr:hypothetical protein [Pseudoalteromonas sp. SG45-5]
MARKKCWHYSISPNFEMPSDRFIEDLDKLAYNAGIKIKGAKHAEH